MEGVRVPAGRLRRSGLRRMMEAEPPQVEMSCTDRLLMCENSLVFGDLRTSSILAPIRTEGEML